MVAMTGKRAAERGALSGASAMPEIAKPWIFGEQRLDFSPRSVVARVIDRDHFTEGHFGNLGESLFDQ